MKRSTSNCMVYGELGCYPVSINIKCRMISFWARLIEGPRAKLSCIMYNCMLKMNGQNGLNFQWLNCIKNILNECGLSYIWDSQQFPSKEWLKLTIQQNLKDQFIQKWSSDLFSNNKCLNYRIFKNELKLEPYLLSLPFNLRLSLTKFRCRNNKFPIETGAYKNIVRAERICNLCSSGEIGDEFHYLFSCSHFSDDRKKLIKCIYYKNPSTLKMCSLLNLNSANLNLARFCKILLDGVM